MWRAKSSRTGPRGADADGRVPLTFTLTLNPRRIIWSLGLLNLLLVGALLIGSARGTVT